MFRCCATSTGLVWAMAIAATLTCGEARADGPTFLTWNACRGASSATAAVTFECSPTGVVYTLVGTFGLADSLKGAYSMLANLDLTFPSLTAVPAFWDITQLGCDNVGLISLKSPPDDCAGQPSAFCAGDTTRCDILFTTASIRGPNRLSLALTVSRSRTEPADLVPLPQRYHGFSLQLSMEQAGTCEGCSAPVAIVWNSGILSSVDADGLDRPPVVIGSADPGAEPCATSNGGVGACGITPVRSRTWGALKELYR